MASSKVINGKVGEELTVSLPGGGGTGCTWKVLKGDPPNMEVRKEFLLPPGIGGMGKEIWNLKFLFAGEFVLVLGFTAPSGGEVYRTETFKIIIK